MRHFQKERRMSSHNGTSPLSEHTGPIIEPPEIAALEHEHYEQIREVNLRVRELEAAAETAERSRKDSPVIDLEKLQAMSTADQFLDGAVQGHYRRMAASAVVVAEGDDVATVLDQAVMEVVERYREQGREVPAAFEVWMACPLSEADCLAWHNLGEIEGYPYVADPYPREVDGKLVVQWECHT
jgi:hypothetical protein